MSNILNHLSISEWIWSVSLVPFSERKQINLSLSTSINKTRQTNVKCHRYKHTHKRMSMTIISNTTRERHTHAAKQRKQDDKCTCKYSNKRQIKNSTKSQTSWSSVCACVCVIAYVSHMCACLSPSNPPATLPVNEWSNPLSCVGVARAASGGDGWCHATAAARSAGAEGAAKESK